MRTEKLGNPLMFLTPPSDGTVRDAEGTCKAFRDLNLPLC